MAALTRARGFTLVELLATIGIVGLLAVIAVPVISGARGRADAAKCLGNLRQLGVALNAYLAENNETMPTLLAGRKTRNSDELTIDVALAEYANGAQIFRCPADPGAWRESGTSYYWNPTLNGQRANALNFLGLTESVTRIPVLSDKEGWHAGGRGPRVNILYADGHAAKGLNLVADE